MPFFALHRVKAGCFRVVRLKGMEAYVKEPRIIPHQIVADGPVFENIMMGDDIDVLKFPKYIVVGDEDVDVTNLDHLLWAMLTRTDPKESIQFIEKSWNSQADPRMPHERRAVGDFTHSVAIIDACKPFHWRDKFPPTNAPSAEVLRKAKERFGWLLDGEKAG